VTVHASIASPSTIDRLMVFSLELCVNVISPHATKVTRSGPICRVD
jgi:hypothetical protein